MKTDLKEIRESLVKQFQDFIPPLQARKSNYECYELSGRIKAMQGKQEVDGFYFASVVPKPKDIRLYFFPIYTHPAEYTSLSDELKKYDRRIWSLQQVIKNDSLHYPKKNNT